MDTVEQLIETYIQYDGSWQGLWTDYGTVFSHYLQRFRKELAHCSLFESREYPNVLTIRHTYLPQTREHMFSIYRTDENAQPIQPVFTSKYKKTVTQKFLDMYHEDMDAEKARLRARMEKQMIRVAGWGDLPTLTMLGLRLWPGHTEADLKEEFSELLRNPEAQLYLKFQADIPVGFAQCQLRHDYVEGTDSSPVGYLEGIYVMDRYRGQGFARQLLEACENWAAEVGCTEFASDCESDNTDSLRFHRHTGFAEANRIICFVKELKK